MYVRYFYNHTNGDKVGTKRYLNKMDMAGEKPQQAQCVLG